MELTILNFGLNFGGLLLMIAGLVIPRLIKDKYNASMIGMIINSILAGYYMGGLLMYFMMK